MEHIALGELLSDLQVGFATSDDEPSGTFQFRMNNLTANGALDLSKRRRVKPTDLQMERMSVAPGDILFNATNSIEMVGKSGLIKALDEPATFSNHFYRLRFGDHADAAYVQHYLAYHFQRGFFRGVAKQWVNQAAVPRDALERLKIPLPPLPEQRRFASILNEADALRATRRHAIARLDSERNSLFTAVFGDPMSTPGDRRPLGDLAAKYSDGPFGSNLKSSHYVQSGVRVIRLQNIGVGAFQDEDQAFVSDEHFQTILRHECLPGDVLIGTLGDPNLRACILPDTVPRAVNKADCVQFRPDSKQVTAEYVEALLNHPSIGRAASHLVLGQTRGRISMGRLRGLEVPVPPMSEQQAFATAIRAWKDVRGTHTRHLAKLDELFASLQHRAFRGEL